MGKNLEMLRMQFQVIVSQPHISKLTVSNSCSEYLRHFLEVVIDSLGANVAIDSLRALSL